jgi:glycine cleavage system H protein
MSGADTADLLQRLPADRLYAPEQDMWVIALADGTVKVGATHWVAGHGQFMLFTPRPVGALIARDRSLGVMETAKSAVAVHAPVSGRIVEVNRAVVDDVTRIERDPYGEGWLLRMDPTDWEEERLALLEAGPYADWLAPRLAARLAGPVEDKPDLTIDPLRGW